jgi:hypothetical protein
MRAPEKAALQRNGREPVSPRWVPHPNGAFFATLGWDFTAAEFEEFEILPRGPTISSPSPDRQSDRTSLSTRSAGSIDHSENHKGAHQ